MSKRRRRSGVQVSYDTVYQTFSFDAAIRTHGELSMIIKNFKLSAGDSVQICDVQCLQIRVPADVEVAVDDDTSANVDLGEGAEVVLVKGAASSPKA